MGKNRIVNYEKEYRKIYEILLGVDNISESQLNRLVCVYGIDFIGLVLKYMLKENSELVYRIVKINSDLNLYLDKSLNKFSVYEVMMKGNIFTDDTVFSKGNKKDIENKNCNVCEKEDNETMALVGAYLRDMSYIDEISDDEKKILLYSAIIKVNEINNLLKLAGSDNLVLPKGKRAWIADKLNYCLENCCDKELLEKINKLYKEYVDVRERIIDGYLRFVISIAKKHYKPGVVPLIDLVQFGNMGLMLAVELYNYDYGIEFSTFASKWIENHILAYSKKVMYEIRKPSHIFEYNNKRIKAVNVLSQKLGRMPTNEEISEYTGLSLDKIFLVEKSFMENVSLDEENEFEYDGFTLSMRESILDVTVDVEEEVINSFLCEDLGEILEENLNKRELQIIKYVYYDDLNFRETAVIMGVSPTRVGQIHKKIIEKLNKKKVLRKLKGYL